MRNLIREMDTELELIIEKMKELQMHAETLTVIRVSLSRYKEFLDDAWVSEEIEGINAELEAMNLKIKWLSEELYGIGYDMLKACDELLKGM